LASPNTIAAKAVSTKQYSPVQRPDEKYGQDNTNSQEKNSFKGFIPAAFRDHVPVLYAVHIWNNIVLNRNEKLESHATL